jgi:hypothetical protein
MENIQDGDSGGRQRRSTVGEDNWLRRRITG